MPQDPDSNRRIPTGSRPQLDGAFIRCDLQGRIRPEGWHNWGKEDNEQTARYLEAGSTGRGARSRQRVKWAQEPREVELRSLTAKAILAGNDDWDPR